MKLNKLIPNLVCAAMIACTGLSCTDISGIEERLDSVESDIKALQGQLASVNSNFEALESLKGAIVISNVESTANGYNITLSNGETLELSLVVEEKEEVVEKEEILGSIVISETSVKITLADGKEVNVPVVENFKFAVKLNGSVVSGVQEFVTGDVVEYAVEQTNVASAAIVACPAGFSVNLEDTMLTVTATGTSVKSTPAVKATASSENEIAILAVSNQGHSVITKLTVNLTAAEEPDVPVAKVKLTSSAITFNSITFAAELTDADAYVYQCLAASEEEPALETLKALEAKTDAEFTVEGLNPNTDYKVYAVAKNGEGVWGDIVSVPFKTADATSYELYNAGMDIKIGDLTINKTTHGEATLINKDSENKNIAANGVYFVASDAADVTINGSGTQIMVLSADENMATIKRTENKSLYINASAENDYLVLSNIKYETVMTSGNVFGIGGDGEVETIMFNKCKIEIPTDMNMLYGAKNILNFIMTDCDVKLHKGTAEKNILQTNTTNTYTSVVFRNNIFYSTDGARSNFKLFANDNATIASLEVKNNTIADLYTKANYGYISCKSITSGEIVSNLFYIPTYNDRVVDNTSAIKYCGIIRMPKDTPETGVTVKSNLAFYNYDAVPGTRMKVSFYRSDVSGELYNKAKADNPVASPDYTNGVFTQGDDYKSFGAKR